LTVTLAARLSGAVWGHLIGDAIGVPYEFRAPSEIREVVWGHRGVHKQPAGTWSDDGGLMLASLDSLVSVGFDTTDQGKRFLAWRDAEDYKPGQIFDVGTTTDAALDRLRTGAPAETAGGNAEQDNGNGSLMRILPVALVGRRLLAEELVGWACRSSCITHAHPRAQVTCAVYCLLVRALLDGKGPDDALEASFAAAHSALPAGFADELARLRAYDQRSGHGYVLDCFWSAFEAFRSNPDFASTIFRAIRFGHDTDTTAAVAGGLAGAHWGIGSIPSEWLAGMRGRTIVTPLIEKLSGIPRWRIDSVGA